MKKLIFLVIAIPSLLYAQNASEKFTNSYHNYSIGDSIYFTYKTEKRTRLSAAQSTMIEKRQGKYKKVKINTNYKGEFSGVQDLPSFLNCSYYVVLGNVVYQGINYIKLGQVVDNKNISIIIPQKILDDNLLNTLINVSTIKKEVDSINKRYYYLDKEKWLGQYFDYSNTYRSNKELRHSLDYFKHGSDIENYATTANYCDTIIEGHRCLKFYWTGYCLTNEEKYPYAIKAKIKHNNSENYFIDVYIYNDILQKLINAGALIGQQEIDKIRRDIMVKDSLSKIKDSLNLKRDKEVILGTIRITNDTVAFYYGNKYSQDYTGYCNNKIVIYSKWNIDFINDDDREYLDSRGFDGDEIRKEVARIYDSIASIRYEQQRETKKIQKQNAIDSTIRICKKKQIFIINQEYAYGEYGKFGLRWSFYNCFNKTIKYIELKVIPINQVGDVQKDDIGRKQASAKCIGPIEVGEAASYSFNDLFWDDKDLISKLRVTSIKITFMDNSIKTYSGWENIKKRMLKYN